MYKVHYDVLVSVVQLYLIHYAEIRDQSSSLIEHDSVNLLNQVECIVFLQ